MCDLGQACDLGQVCLMKVFDNYEAVPDTKQYVYIQCNLFGYYSFGSGAKQETVPRPADSKTTLLMSLPQGEYQVFLSKSLPGH